jgi:glycolate oxidase FAD binding subunit
MVVEAGLPLQVLAARAAEANQRLAVDPWPGTAASIGGAVAANRNGPARLQAGSLRDALLGCRVAHADGTSTRSGGRVVKNVTGYDLPKLYVGSLGTLVILTELNLRLSPQPETSLCVWARAPWLQARDMLLQMHQQGPRAAALAAFIGHGIGALPWQDDAVHLLARFEGREPVVRHDARACARAWGGEELPPEEGRVVWEALRQHEEPQEGQQVFRVSSLPTAGMEVLDFLRPFLHADGSALMLFAVGTCSVRMPASLPAAEGVRLQERLEAAGATLRWLHTEGRERSLLRGSRPVALALHEATKSLFDAERILPSLSWRNAGGS